MFKADFHMHELRNNSQNDLDCCVFSPFYCYLPDGRILLSIAPKYSQPKTSQRSPLHGTSSQKPTCLKQRSRPAGCNKKARARVHQEWTAASSFQWNQIKRAPRRTVWDLPARLWGSRWQWRRNEHQRNASVWTSVPLEVHHSVGGSKHSKAKASWLSSL